MAEQFTHGYALLIGVDQNSVPEWALPGVAHDLQALHEVLVHPQRCAYDPAHVKWISGKDASKANILAGIDWLQSCLAADGEATVVVYYSGHGWRDDGAQPAHYYFIPYDVRRDRLRGSALRADEFGEAIEALQPPRLFVVLDCCHAGGMNVKDLGAPYQPAAAPLDLIAAEGAIPAENIASKEIGSKGIEQLFAGGGRAVLTSSRAEQKSYISAKAKMSIFTWHLIEALTGSAQPQAGAPEVLVSDVLSYVYRHVPATARQEAGVEQQPDGRLTGNFAIAMLLGGKGLAAGEKAPVPSDPLPTLAGAAAGGRTLHIGKIEAINVAEHQVIDQRGANFQIGGSKTESKVDTGGGTYVGGNVTAGGDFVGRDRIDRRGSDSRPDASKAFTKLAASVALRASTADVDKAMQCVQAMQQAFDQGDDDKVADCIGELADLAPGVKESLQQAFSYPALHERVGPATKYALRRLG